MHVQFTIQGAPDDPETGVRVHAQRSPSRTATPATLAALSDALRSRARGTSACGTTRGTTGDYVWFDLTGDPRRDAAALRAARREPALQRRRARCAGGEALSRCASPRQASDARRRAALRQAARRGRC